MKKTIAAVSTAILGVSVLFVGVASATTPTPTETAVTGAALTLKDELINIGTAVLPYGAAVLALTLGWRFAKKFVRG